MIGGIAVMQERDNDGAARILAARPSHHTVLNPTREVNGEYRTRRFDVLAGIPTTRTHIIEYGHRFTIDLSAAYFSSRLATERRRITSLVQTGEIILDMFAGVGPFAIALADQAELVIAADINPGAIALMLENILQNHTRSILPILADARRLTEIIPWQFDRIIMNLPLSGPEFLQHAFALARDGGYIHFYVLMSRESEHRQQIADLGGEMICERVVRSYSPRQWHAVFDVRKKRK
jgi:tRNA (guanine37-N1)-methyltransferase